MKHDQAEGLRRKLGPFVKQAKTVSVISGKGGVGKSNFALNFSLQLIANGKKVLLFDLDIGMGNIDILMGLRAEKTIVDMFQNHLTIEDIIETGPKGLSYIAGGSGLNGFFHMNGTDKDFFYEQYRKLLDQYDYILFDMGAGVTEDGLYFILASDECIVITTPEPTSITDAYGMIKHVTGKQKDMPIYVVMNRSTNHQTGLNALEQFKKVVVKFLGIEIKAMGIIPNDKTVIQAVLNQVPFVMFNERSKASKAMDHIAYRYVTQSKEISRNTSFSFVQKLKQLMER